MFFHLKIIIIQLYYNISLSFTPQDQGPLDRQCYWGQVPCRLMKSPPARQYLGTPPISLKVAYYQGRKQARLSQVHLHSWSVSALRPYIMLTAASLPQRLC